MVRPALSASSIACVVVLASIAAPVHFFVAGASAAVDQPVGGPAQQIAEPIPPADRPDTYAIGQAGQCVAVEPLGNGSQTGVEFYGMEGAPEYSSLGTVDLQRPGTSQLFVHNGSEGHNLVFLHGDFESPDNGGPEAGGSISVTISGLPQNGSWTVEDDSYSGRDDNFVHNGTTSHIDWMWQPDKTDGGVFHGLVTNASEWEAITIEPAFEKESYGYLEAEPRWEYANDTISEWIVRDGSGGTMHLDKNQTVSIRAGPCDETSPNASLEAGAHSTTEPIPLDASDSTSGTAIVAYRWDFNGDGTVDRTTTTPTTTYNDTDEGDDAPVVTVVDRFGNTDTAADAPLTAVARVPDTVQLGGIFRADASRSIDGGTITNYEWDFDGDVSAAEETGQVVEHRYSARGDNTITLTVTDDDGYTDSDTATITVLNATAPAPSLSVPRKRASPNSTVRLDATASSDADGIEEFRWDFDGNGTIDQVTLKGSLRHQYTTLGSYTPTVTVVDADGGMSRATSDEPIEIVPNTQPTAELSVPESAQAGTSVTLDATGSSDEDGILSYRWDFDDDGVPDDTTSKGETTRSFDSIGTHTVSVTVRDSTEKQSTRQDTIEIVDQTEPTAVIDGPSEATLDESVTFSGAASTDAGTITDYAWTVNGNDVATSDTFEHAFSEEGSYTVELTVTDEAGNQNTTATTVSAKSAESTGSGGGGGGGGGGTPSGGGGGGSTGGASSGGGGAGGGSAGGASAASSSSSSASSTSSTDDATGDDDRFDVSELSLSSKQTAIGEDLQITATVVNRDTANRTETVMLSVNDRRVESRTVSVPARTAMHVSFRHRFETEGSYTVGVEDQRRTVRVAPNQAAGTPSVAVTDVSVQEESLDVGDTVSVIATVTNTGSAEGSTVTALSMYGEVVDRKTVTVPPNGTRTVRFTREVDSPGAYSVSVNGHEATMRVAGQTPTPQRLTGGETDTDRVDPVWLLLGGIIALASLGLIINRRD